MVKGVLGLSTLVLCRQDAEGQVLEGLRLFVRDEEPHDKRLLRRAGDHFRDDPDLEHLVLEQGVLASETGDLQLPLILSSAVNVEDVVGALEHQILRPAVGVLCLHLEDLALADEAPDPQLLAAARLRLLLDQLPDVLLGVDLSR